MKKYIFIILVLLSYNLNSQSLSIFDIDTTNFPKMKAKFYAFDKDGNQIINLSPSDCELKENGQQYKVTSISCPAPQPPQALSSVLVFDISGSMNYGPPRIQSAKDAANSWVDGLQSVQSECALVSFSDISSIITDFTNNKEKLKNKIKKLVPSGGTNYNQALIDLPCGGLQIAKKGKYKRVLIFLTDGLPNFEPRTNEIIRFANSNNISIYAVTLDMKAPQSIKDMTLQTGGQYFENITTLKEAQDTYQKLLRVAQGGDPCEITWESGVSCVAGMKIVELKHQQNGTTATTSYQSPNASVAKLEFEPSSLKFIDPQVGVKVEQKVTITARNADFNVSNITSNNGGFEITPKSFVLNSGQSLELTVSYLPADSGYNFCRFDIENDNCSTKYLTSGGWKGKKPKVKTLKIIHPNGGEVFVAGSDTIITWEGVGPDEPVKIEYRMDDNKPWMKIADSANGLSYKWKVPKTPSDKCLARVTAEVKSTVLDDNMVLIPAGTFQMGNTGAYSGNGNDKPVHAVTITRDFLMSKFEITQKQYELVTGLKPSYYKGDNLPVEQVSWYDAIAYCNKRSEMEGFEKCYSGSGDNIVCDWNANGYRLPTEAEWEYACKAGTTTDFYNGSLTNPDCSPLDLNLDKIGWYCGNSSKTHEVGQKDPNAFKLYDMSGNVSEWCWDWIYTYGGSSETDPIGPYSGTSRTSRGGLYFHSASKARSSYRSYGSPDNSYNSQGFRVCRTY